MTEHEKEWEKLKTICDKIWYWTRIRLGLDVREIIFTEDFIDKLRYELKVIHWKDNAYIYINKLLEYLDNPVNYLYNLIKDSD